MAELAWCYHQNLQNDIEPHLTHEERSQQITRTLKAIPVTQIIENPRETRMNEFLSEENVRHTLALTKNGTATGIDGCPYKLWKALEKRYNDDTNVGKTSLNLIKVLTIVYQDIQQHGLNDTSNFALGWMCPLYKKKDLTEICNYRLITLLNTDYKILTKALALQLVSEIENLVHMD